MSGEREKYALLDDLIHDEEEYVGTLHRIDQLFIQKIDHCRHASVVDNVYVSILAASLTQLLTLHTEFLAVLQRRRHSTQGMSTLILSDIFAQYVKLFKCYGHLCRSWSKGRTIIFHSKDTNMIQFLNTVSRDFIAEGFAFEQELSKPMQRLPEYALFLHELLWISDTSSKEHERLVQCHEWWKETASDIAVSIEAMMRSEQLFQLESSFSGSVNLFRVGRCLKMKAKLTKVCRSFSKPYIFHLFNDILLYSSESGAGLKLHRRMPLHECKAHDLPDSKRYTNAFEISSCDKSFIVYASNRRTKHAFLQELVQCIQDLEVPRDLLGTTSRADTLRGMTEGRSTSRLQWLAPVWVPDDDVDTCGLCSIQFSLLNRKHHCRGCGNIVCYRCSAQRVDMGNATKRQKRRVCDECVEAIEKRKRMAETEARKRIQPERGSLSSLYHGSGSREDVIREIVATERSYCAKLQTLHQLFIRPLVEAPLALPDTRKVCKIEIDETIVSIPVHKISGPLSRFLAQIETIILLSLELLRDLESRANQVMSLSEAASVTVGDVFVQYANLFKLYGEFAKLHHNAAVMLGSDEFQPFIKACERHPLNASEEYLSSYLILPVQRIPRYELLLRDLLKKTGPGDRDRAYIQQALSKIHEVAGCIDEAIRQHESREEVRRIQGQFGEDIMLLAGDRSLMKSGNLVKIGKYGKGTTYTFHLFNDLFMYSSQTVTGKLRLHRSFYLGKINVHKDPQDSRVLIVTSNQKSFRIMTPSNEVCDSWLDAFERANASIRHEAMEEWPTVHSHMDQTTIPKVGDEEQRSRACAQCHMEFRFPFKRHFCRLCGDTFCSSCASQKMVLQGIDTTTPQRVCHKCYSGVLHRLGVKVDDVTTRQSVAHVHALAHEHGLDLQNQNHLKRCWAIATGQVLWMDDSYSDECLLCYSLFSKISRKHHCRQCGILVCNDCSSNSRPLASIDQPQLRSKAKLARVCDACVSILDENKR